MNKQELIEKYEGVFKKLYAFPVVTINEVLEDLKQLDEPKEKVTIPRPVANWISCVRGRNKTLHFALENAPEEVNLWFCEDEKNRQNIFANAWVNGYHIEKEKRYRVKLKNADISYSLLKHNTAGDWWFGIDFDEESHAHTRKELEKAGFGEVFDSTLFEVKEVEE